MPWKGWRRSTVANLPLQSTHPNVACAIRHVCRSFVLLASINLLWWPAETSSTHVHTLCNLPLTHTVWGAGVGFYSPACPCYAFYSTQSNVWIRLRTNRVMVLYLKDSEIWKPITLPSIFKLQESCVERMSHDFERLELATIGSLPENATVKKGLVTFN